MRWKSDHPDSKREFAGLPYIMLHSLAHLLFDLVLSGPEVPGVPTADTAATLGTLIKNAETEILLVGYTVHNGKRLFKRLAERMEATPALRVAFCLDIARKATDTSLAGEIVRRFGREFVTKHWPGKRLPEVFYDPRALAETWEERARLSSWTSVCGANRTGKSPGWRCR